MERPLSIATEPPSRSPRPKALELVAIFLGGFIGSLVRSGLARGFPAHGGSWPWGTFIVNIAAALLLGYLVGLLRGRRSASVYSRAFLAIGLCGALSTFSTLMIELLGMLESSRWALAGAYAIASIAGGLAAVALGSRLARRRSATR